MSQATSTSVSGNVSFAEPAAFPWGIVAVALLGLAAVWLASRK